MILICLAHFPEVIVGLDNGVGIGKVALQKKHEECQRVGQAPHEQHPLTFLFRQILVKKQKVVAEIEISFPWIPLVEGCASYMIHFRIAKSADPEPCGGHPAAQVNLLHVGEKERVEAAELQVEIGAHH